MTFKQRAFPTKKSGWKVFSSLFFFFFAASVLETNMFSKWLVTFTLEWNIVNYHQFAFIHLFSLRPITLKCTPEHQKQEKTLSFGFNQSDKAFQKLWKCLATHVSCCFIVSSQGVKTMPWQLWKCKLRVGVINSCEIWEWCMQDMWFPFWRIADFGKK